MDSQKEDIDHVKQLKNGNRIAFINLFNKYHHALYYHFLNFLKSPDLTKDAVQEVFIRVWENRENLDPDQSFKGFLFRIARNHIFNILKRAGKEASIKEEIIYYSSEAHNRTENEVIYNEYEKFAHDAIKLLPPQRQLIFKKSKFDGLDNDEIARELQISKHTVRKNISHAVRFIKDYFYEHAGVSLGVILFSLFYWFF